MNDLPEKPGVYLLKDTEGCVLYVGKALSIKNRVSDHARDETKKFYNRVTSVDYITTRNEKEALILEDNLIKKYRPRFNIRMKDDKEYPLILITSEKYPRIQIVRKRNREGIFFGPYTDSLAIKNVVKFVSKTFGIAACDKSFKTRNRPCLKHHLKYCLAPCCEKISREEYHENINSAIRFLSGDVSYILSTYETQMNMEAEKMNYEKAVIYRDKIRSIKHLQEKQKVFLPNDRSSRDFICFIITEKEVHAERLRLREGRLVGEDHFILENVHESTPETVIEYLMEREYQHNSDLPETIIISFYIGDKEYKWVRKKVKLNKNIILKKTVTEDEKSLIQLAFQNSVNRIKIITNKSVDKFNSEALELKQVLNLPVLPEKIEGYDISHHQGANAYGSMVVFYRGAPEKKEYRIFKLNSPIQDDYAYLEEVLNRRFKNYVDKYKNFAYLPDIILIDGGKSHLSITLKVLRSYGLQVPTVALAKEDESLFSNLLKYPLNLPRRSPALQLLQRVRDEAHRFSQRHYRKKHAELKTILLTIKGVGSVRANRILNQLKNTKNIYNLSYEELLNIKGVPQQILRRIYEQLHK
ncbi:MAG: UvrABC system protein C [candidate division WS2 bacterium]|nr:UvrABC system protein C [Candidatus Lithacetigena glycinireducens]